VEKCSREEGTGTIGLGIQNRFKLAKYEGTRRGFMRPRCVRATVSEGLRLEAGTRVPHPRVFSEKRLQTIENKGRECRKERKETGERQQMPESNGFATPAGSGTEAQSSEGDWRLVPPHPGGNGDRCQDKGVAGKAIRKNMKSKG